MEQRRIVLTGGPGAGKTAALELARRALCGHVDVVREAATVVFGGGFPRETSEPALRAEQRAIYHVQRELEALGASHEKATTLLCDRGTVDALAYWPGEERRFFADVGTSYEAELSRYDLVIHLRPPTEGNGYHTNLVRIESASEAARLDARIERAWQGHPRRVFIESSRDFVEKVTRVIARIREELPEACRYGHT
jgi:predicted ATPase